MKRYAVPLIAVGGLGVLVALGALLMSVTNDAGAPAVTPTARPTETPVAPAPRPTNSPTRSAPLPQLAPSRPRETASSEPSRDRAPPPSIAPSSDDAPPGTRANTKGLQYGIAQLRAKIGQNTARIAECVQASGARPTGNATVTFIVADRAGKIVVEQADVDHDATTLTDDTLLSCFTKATSGMQFDGLPREAPAIVVTRTIALQDGSVVEDKPAKFSYLR